MSIDESSPHAAETLWLLRHAALCIERRQAMPDHTRAALAARHLSPSAKRFLLVALAELLRRPLALAPPCSSWHSRHEVLLLRALAALEQGRDTHARLALADLAAPALLSRRALDGACGLLARLSGYPAADRCRPSWPQQENCHSIGCTCGHHPTGCGVDQ